MEKLLTTEADEFKRFLHDSEDPAPSEADHRQAYHYGMVRLLSVLPAVAMLTVHTRTCTDGPPRPALAARRAQPLPAQQDL